MRPNFLKPRDKNLAAAKSNSQRPFYHSSDFDSIARQQKFNCVKTATTLATKKLKLFPSNDLIGNPAELDSN